MRTSTNNVAEQELRALRATLARVANLVDLEQELRAKVDRLRTDVGVVETDLAQRQRQLEKVEQQLGVATHVQHTRASALTVLRQALGDLEKATAEISEDLAQLDHSTVGEMFFVPILDLDAAIGKARVSIQALADRRVENMFLVSAQDAVEEALRHKVGLRYGQAYYFATVAQVFCHVVEQIEQLQQQEAKHAAPDPDAEVKENLYKVLGVEPHATDEQIRRVYHRLVKRYHPDVKGTGDEERFKMIQLAFEILSDPRRRAAYDARRKGASV